MAHTSLCSPPAGNFTIQGWPAAPSFVVGVVGVLRVLMTPLRGSKCTSALGLAPCGEPPSRAKVFSMATSPLWMTCCAARASASSDRSCSPSSASALGTKASAPSARSPMKLKRSSGLSVAGSRPACRNTRSISSRPQPSGRASLMKPGKALKCGGNPERKRAPRGSSGRCKGECSTRLRKASLE